VKHETKMTTVGYRSPTYAQIAADQRPGVSAAASSLGVPLGDTGYAPTLPGNPTLYTRDPNLPAGSTSAVGNGVPWSAPSNIYRLTTTQTNLDNNSSLENSEDRFRARAAAVGVFERFAPRPDPRYRTSLGVTSRNGTDQEIRRAQWQPQAVRYPSVNVVQRAVYGASDPYWRRSFTPLDYAGLWDYQKEAMAWRRQHAAQLDYLRCHPGACSVATRRVRYEDSRERPLGA